MASPRFPGDRGPGADVPLENAAKEEVPPSTKFPILQIKPSETYTIPERKPSPLIRKTSANLPPLSGDPSKDLPPLTGDLGTDVGVRGPLAPKPQGDLSRMILGLPVKGEQERTGLSRILLGQPGGWARGGATVAATLARALGASDEAAESWGRGSKTLQRSLAMPWSRIPGLAGLGTRALQGAGLGATEGAIEGEGAKGMGTRALTGAGASIAGDAAAKGLRYLGSAIPHRLYSAKSGQDVTNWLRKNVPAWAGMKGDRALYEMARESGQTKLSDAYERALVAAQDKIPPDVTVSLLAGTAKKLGFSPSPDMLNQATQMAQKFTGATKGVARKLGAEDLVEVSARDLLGRLPGQKDQLIRRQVLDALTEGLPPGSVPEAAMRAYRLGSGWMDFAKKSGLFKEGERYTAATAQEGLRNVGKETLERRGMGDVRNLIRGPLDKPITPDTASNLMSGVGAMAGGVGGSSLGPLGIGGGAGGGAWLGNIMGRKLPVYRNVPETLPQIGQLRRALLQALAQQVVPKQTPRQPIQ
jgi:osmotically-inducible protein OsmY